MAGLGAKLFTAFSKLTAAQVNGYLMDQTIMRFASATARDAAFGGAGEPTLAEGMTCYLDDTNVLQSYTGSAWVSVASSSGAVLQVVSVVVTNLTAFNSTTFSDATNMTLSITPKSTTSKVLVNVQSNFFNSGGNAGNGLNINLLRDSTVIYSPHRLLGYSNTLLAMAGGWSCVFLDSPATTSATTYKIQGSNNVAANNSQINGVGMSSTITLMEISA